MSDARSFPVTAFILNDDGSYGAYTYNNYQEAATDLRDETIIAIIADDEVIDIEITYDSKHTYSKSIFWNKSIGYDRTN